MSYLVTWHQQLTEYRVRVISRSLPIIRTKKFRILIPRHLLLNWHYRRSFNRLQHISRISRNYAIELVPLLFLLCRQLRRLRRFLSFYFRRLESCRC